MRIKHRKKIIWISAFGLLVLLHGSGILRPLEDVFIRTLNPVLGVVFRTGVNIGRVYREQSSRGDYAQAAKDMEQELNRLRRENAELFEIKKENDILREHLGFLERNKYKYEMANIISRENYLDAGARTEAIIIDKGRSSGLFVGLAVVDQQGIIVGKIAEVKENSAKAYLSNSEKCKFAAVVMGQEKTGGIAQGKMGLVIEMKFIPQSSSVSAGGMAVSSGLEPAVPRGLVIGRISEVRKENNDLWQTAALEPISDPAELIIVSVIVPELADG